MAHPTLSLVLDAAKLYPSNCDVRVRRSFGTILLYAKSLDSEGTIYFTLPRSTFTFTLHANRRVNHAGSLLSIHVHLP